MTVIGQLLWESARLLGPEVTEAARPVLEDERFFLWAGVSNHSHHHYAGGLARHTYEVVQIATRVNVMYGLPSGQVFLSALWHDFGKIWEFAEDGSELAGGVWHVPVSARLYQELVGKPDPAVVQAILSHHGRPEWGSAVPVSKLDWLLHLSDSMSARLGA